MFTVVRLIFLPARVGVGTTRLGMKAGYRTGRLVGYKRLAVFGLGVAVGLLVAPTTGRQARDKLRALVEQRRGGVRGDLAERVRFELSHSPRTWHLPQPDVEVVAGTAVLRGDVPHEVGKEDMARTVAAVDGITGVDNRLAVTANLGTNGAR